MGKVTRIGQSRNSVTDAEIDEMLAPLRKARDVVSLVLTAHLIIEAQLIKAIEHHCRDPKHLEKARLSFKQRLDVLQALEPIDKATVEAVVVLNNVRNHLLHNLKRRPYSKLLSEFNRTVEKRLSGAPKADNEVELFMQCLVFTIGTFAAHGAYKAR